jgi:ferredoxin-NADP reductase
VTAAGAQAPASRGEAAYPRAPRTAVREGWLLLRVAGVSTAGRVRSLRLVSLTGDTLPSFTPGSHIVVEAGGRTNAYSLTGDFLEPTAYEISVLLIADGQGGSRWIHDELEVGEELSASPPRSAFAPVASARHHVLVAGGIGITPILSHVRAARLYRRSFEVIYAHRPDAQAAPLRELQALCGSNQPELVHSRAELTATLRNRLSDQPLGSVLFVCGPRSMMEATETIATELGWPAERIHIERFSTAALDPGNPFTVRLSRSGRQLLIPSGVSLLEALEGAEVPVPYLCRRGVCGECRVAVTAGRPEHRDLFLTDEERAAGDSVMCCVSRAHDPLLELDL